MWYREFSDYKPDEPLNKQTIETGRGIIGCQMHEIFGWGNRLHHPQERKKGFLSTLLTRVFAKKNKAKHKESQ